MSQLIFNNNTTRPDTPAADKVKIYSMDDLALYLKDENGDERLIGTRLNGSGPDTELVMTSPNGTNWAIRITNSGSVTRTPI